MSESELGQINEIPVSFFIYRHENELNWWAEVKVGSFREVKAYMRFNDALQHITETLARAWKTHLPGVDGDSIPVEVHIGK